MMMVERINVGVRQFVAKIALKDRRVSFLIPDRSYLNPLPKEEEDRVSCAGT